MLPYTFRIENREVRIEMFFVSNRRKIVFILTDVLSILRSRFSILKVYSREIKNYLFTINSIYKYHPPSIIGLNRNSLSIFLWLLISPFFLNAQQESDHRQDSMLGAYYYEMADSLFLDIDTALYYSHLALPLLKKTKQWELYVFTRCGLNYCYNTKEQYDSMRYNNKRAVDIAKIHLNPNSEAFICATNNQALTFSEIDEDYLKALETYKKTYNLLNTSNSSFSKGPLEENIGQMYYFLGDFETAINYYSQAIASFKLAATPSTIPFIRLAKVYDKLSKVYYKLGQLELAKQHQVKAIQMLYGSADFNQNFATRLLTELVKINISLGDLDSASYQLHQVQKNKTLTPLQTAKLFHHQGVIAFKKGDFPSAIKALTRGFEQDITKDKVREKANIYRSLSQIYMASQQFELALKYQQEAVRLLTKNASLKRDIDIPDSEATVLSSLELFKTFIDKGQTLKQLYQQTGEILYLVAALDSYTYLSFLTDDIRCLYQSEESQLLLLEEAKDFYEEAITAAYELYDQTQEVGYVEKAFFFTEKSKSNLLLDELRKKKFLSKTVVADSLIQQEYALKVAITNYKKLIRKEAAKGEKKEAQKIQTLNQQLFLHRENLGSIKDQLQERFPAYSDLTKQAPINLSNVQNRLVPNQVVLEYFVGQENIYLFKITPSQTDFIKIPNDFDLDQLLVQLFDNLKMTGKNGVTNYITVAHQLYKHLIEPANLTATENNLLIIPDGQLENLPIGILLSNTTTNQSPKMLPYLIRDYTIGYAYSATIFDFQMKQSLSTKSGILGIFPVFSDTSKELFFSDQLYEILSKFVGNYLIKEAATVSNFKKQAENFSILHFFTHARGYDAQHGEPSIDFIDKTLAVSDLQTYHLNAHLAVLGACQTNVGAYKKGEGIMSLSRVFTFAGIPSIITSVATVFEQSTSTIMATLYDNMKQGLPKQIALRNAKEAYLTDPKVPDSQCAPFYWGTFLAIGNTKPIPLTKQSIWKSGMEFFFNLSKQYLGYLLVLSLLVWFGSRMIKKN